MKVLIVDNKLFTNFCNAQAYSRYLTKLKEADGEDNTETPIVHAEIDELSMSDIERLNIALVNREWAYA